MHLCRATAAPFVTALLLASLTLASARAHAQDIPEAEGQEEIVDEDGFFETYFALWPAEDLADPIERNVVPIYLLNLLPFGGLWAPLALNDDPEPPEMGGDIVLPYLVPYLGGGAVNLCLGGGLSVVGSIGASIIGGLLASTMVGVVAVPCAVVACFSPACLSFALGTALQLWIAPSASVNAWGRAYRKAEQGFPDELRSDPDGGPESPGPVPGPVPDRVAPGSDEAARPPADSTSKQSEGSSSQQAPGAPGLSDPTPEVDDDGWVPF